MTQTETPTAEAGMTTLRDADLDLLSQKLRGLSSGWAVFSDERGLASGAMSEALGVIFDYRELAKQYAALSSRTPAGAAGDLVGTWPQHGDRNPCAGEGDSTHRWDEMQGKWVTEEDWIGSGSATPSPESTLSPAQVATGDGGGVIGASIIRATNEAFRSVATTPASAGEGDLREAVEFYASSASYALALQGLQRVPVLADNGDMARAALARHQAPAVDLPAKRERIERLICAHVRLREDAHDSADLDHASVAVAADAILATRPTDPGGARGEIVRHVKSGGEYEVLGEAEAQVSAGDHRVWPKGADPYSNADAMPARLARDGDRLTVYRGSDGKLWCRFTDEFRDGRFVPAASTASSDAGGAV